MRTRREIENGDCLRFTSRPPRLVYRFSFSECEMNPVRDVAMESKINIM